MTSVVSSLVITNCFVVQKQNGPFEKLPILHPQIAIWHSGSPRYPSKLVTIIIECTSNLMYTVLKTSEQVTRIKNSISVTYSSICNIFSSVEIWVPN